MALTIQIRTEAAPDSGQRRRLRLRLRQTSVCSDAMLHRLQRCIRLKRGKCRNQLQLQFSYILMCVCVCVLVCVHVVMCKFVACPLDIGPVVYDELLVLIYCANELQMASFFPIRERKPACQTHSWQQQMALCNNSRVTRSSV